MEVLLLVHYFLHKAVSNKDKNICFKLIKLSVKKATI